MYWLWGLLLIVLLLYELRKEGFTWSDKISRMDYSGNDIGYSGNIGIAQCKKNCVDNPQCKGLGIMYDPDTNPSGKAKCWIKHDMTNGKLHNTVWSYKLTR